TLLNSRLEVAPRTAQAIAAAQERGVQVVIATGRMYSSALPYAQKLALTGPLVTYNGALVRTVRGKTLAHRPIPLEVAQEVLDMAGAKGWVVNCYLDDELYVDEITEGVEYYVSIS